MSLVFCQHTNPSSKIALWKIEENLQFYTSYLGISENKIQELSNVTHPQKQLEWLASRTCVKYLCEQMGIEYRGVAKDEYSNPSLNNHVAHISITHTDLYAAVSISLDSPVGIDIEKISDKLNRVAHKYLSTNELIAANNSLQKKCIYWCAKESLYKWHGKKNLSFKEHIFLDNFDENISQVTGKIIHHTESESSHTLNVYYQDDYILTVTL
ncbi:4'-phosphopantetheinyl transferase family protein [Flectobacillus major]|uniref:4'-phosphopantetheinyl transferase family protein n=1 Tax=Flectobacillus major TaxID=103 RepID=UPI000419AD24|nr:4'-phosphopantetheinyl transferase family protein [Flectobacillus major]